MSQTFLTEFTVADYVYTKVKNLAWSARQAAQALFTINLQISMTEGYEYTVGTPYMYVRIHVCT